MFYKIKAAKGNQVKLNRKKGKLQESNAKKVIVKHGVEK